MENPHALSTQEKWINLSRKEIKHIFIYYCSIFIISLIVFGIIIYRFIGIQTDNIGMLLILSFNCGLLGSTFYYML